MQVIDKLLSNDKLFSDLFLQTTDADTGNYQKVWYRFLTAQGAPVVINKETGVITTVRSFTGEADHNYSLIVEAYDNEGVSPSLNNRISIAVSQANFNCVMLYVVAITNAADHMIQSNLCIMLENYTAPY